MTASGAAPVLPAPSDETESDGESGDACESAALLQPVSKNDRLQNAAAIIVMDFFILQYPFGYGGVRVNGGDTEYRAVVGFARRVKLMAV